MPNPTLARSLLEEYGLNPKFPESVDSSMLKDFIDCPQLFYLRHVLGLRKANLSEQDISHLDWGTMWHKLHEVLNRTGDKVAALAVLKDWPPYLNPENDKHGRGKLRMTQIFFDYIERFSLKDELEYEMIREEQFFDVFNEELDLRWCGRIDLIRKERSNGRLIVWDYKTTSRMGPNWFDGYEYSFQLPGYVWAANQISTTPIDRIKIDALYTLKASHDFFRRTIRYTQPELDQWVRTVKQWLTRLYELRDRALYDPEEWPLNWNECTRYSRCQFTDICHGLPQLESRLMTMAEDYREERWDPRTRES